MSQKHTHAVRLLPEQDLHPEPQDRSLPADLLEHRERLALLGELVASVAHELNAPLGYLRSNLESLEGRLLQSGALAPELRAEVQPMLEDCLEGAERLFELVDCLRTGARRPEKVQSEVDLSLLVQRAAVLVKTHGRALETRMLLSPGAVVWGDFGRLLQVVLNLLVNARQAIQCGGRIILRTGGEGDRVFLEVEDDGPGVPPELAERIFEPFFTTKPGATGTGLGLSLSRRIAREQGGELTLRQGSFGGACFRLTLPAAQAMKARTGRGD